jgi:4,5-DOPA dioxygenase extradiol
MNAIEDTAYSRGWRELGRTLPRPQAILVVSAHWMTDGTTLVDVSAMPRMIHDFYGFPRELYEQQYPAPGAPELAAEVATLLASHHVAGDDTWGLDHGAWSVLKSLFPDADVPVFQLSIDVTRDLDWHLDIGRPLAELRNRGVLILGSGNIVHNLRTMRQGGRPFEWAEAFDENFSGNLRDRNLTALANLSELGALFRQAHPTVDHYLPALTIAGASDAKDHLTFMNEGIDLGSVSMRSFIFH